MFNVRLKEVYLMKRKIQILMLFIFVLTISACVPVPVVVGPQDSGYNDQYGYDEYGSGYDNNYYDVPINYGEPCYYPPPVNVTFAFDYFTYEIVNGYVDIVFWRGGHRYHHEPWQEHGRRISANDIRSRDFHHRIRGSELYQHRKMLREKNNIYHPDKYYGVKPPSRHELEEQKRLREQQQQDQEKQRRIMEQQQKREQEKQRILKEQQQEQERQRYLLDLQKQEHEGKKRSIEMQKQERENQKRLLEQQRQNKQKRLIEQQKQQQEKQKRLMEQKKQEQEQEKEKQKKLKERLKKPEQEQQQQKIIM